MFSVQLLPEKVIYFIKVKEALIDTEQRIFLEKVLKLNDIKKAQKVQHNCLLVQTGNGRPIYQ